MGQSAMTIAKPGAEVAYAADRLVEAWRHEFLHVAMMTAFVTMGCNALLAYPTDAALDGIEANVPEEPAIYRAIRQGLLEVPPVYSAAFISAQSAYDDLTRAIEVLANVRAQSSGRLSALVPGLSHGKLADSWRATCRSFLNAVGELERSGLLRDIIEAEKSLNAQCPVRLMQLLRAAVAGETLLSSGIGQTTPDALPHWAQRRRWHRRHFNMRVSVSVKGRSYVAIVRNISLGGALIDDMPTLMRGTPLVINTNCGRALSAGVMWVRASSLGVKFDEQLLYNDPLIEAAGP